MALYVMSERTESQQERGIPMKALSLGKVLRKIHRDEDGAVSLETVLIIGAIALPILIFLIKVAWPGIQSFFNQGVQNLESGAQTAEGGN